MFSVVAFMPHGMCYLWRPEILALHIISDSLITLAYFSIPFTLLYFVGKRTDLRFSWIFVAFAVFIVACGATHLLEIWTIWYPTYWLSGGIKAVTALASVCTAFLLVKLVPTALRVPSPALLAATNAELANEVAERKRAEDQTRRANESLERRIAERTAELVATNEMLKEGARQRHESAELHSLTLASIRDGVIVTGVDGIITLVNVAAEHLIGCEPANAIGASLFSIFNIVDAMTLTPIKELTQLLRNTDPQTPVTLDLILIAAQGREVPIELRSAVLGADQGNNRGLVLTFHDASERRRFQAELVRTNERFAVASDAAGLGYWELDVASGSLYWDDRMYRLYGCSRLESDQPSVIWGTCLHPEDRERVENEMRGAIEGGGSFDTEFRVIRSNGEVRHLKGSCGVKRDLAGRSVQVFGTNFDITERKYAEEMQQKMAALIESAEDAIMTKSLDGIIRSWNPGAERLLGYRAEEIIGQPISRLLPDDREGEESMIIAKIRNGQRVAHFETVRKKHDGSQVDVSLTISPIRDRAGNIVGASKIMRDIGERKRATAALQESEGQFRTMVDAIPQLAWMANDDGHVVWYNQRWFDYTNTSPEQMEGWGWQSVHDPRYLPTVLERWKASIATGEVFEMEFPMRAADGHFGWFLTRVVPFRNAAGQVMRWFGTNTDLSEQRNAADEIGRLNANLEQRVAERTSELEAFSYTVSHDLRAPLRHLQGYVELLKRETAAAPLPEPARRHLKTIADVSAEMGQLIDDLLAFSRMGKAELNYTHVLLNELVQEIIGGLDVATRARHIDWQIAALPPVLGDPSALKQVFANLIGNAVKYTRPRDHARIEIGCSGEENGRLILFVRDNGVGFDMQYSNKLFGVFQRLHRTQEFEGTGIGLAIVHRVITRHDGRVWAEAALNEGATFYFTLRPAAVS